MTWKTNDPCVMCGVTMENGNIQHHLYTRKARPDLQEKTWNLFPCCLSDHNKLHSDSLFNLSNKNQHVKSWLIRNDWYICPQRNKWVHDGANLN